MGAGISASSHLQSIPKQNWQEVQHAFLGTRPVQYGKCKFYINTITFEEIEQYSLHFQSNQECEDYLLLFRRRLKDEHLVNGRFIDLENIHLCGCGKIATVYLQKIPIRFIEIKTIQEQDFLYVLINSLKGFQKLYKIRGFFRPSQEMIGFDRQGRLKVWLNPNFSKAFINSVLSDPYTKITEIYQADYEQQMVWQIIKMVQAKAPDQSTFHRYRKIFLQRQEEQQQKLSFVLAKKRIVQYAQSCGIQIKQYFDTIIPLIRHINQSSQQMIAQGSSVDFQGISFHPIKRKNKIIYYVNPYQQSQGSSSDSSVSEHITYQKQLQDKTLFHNSSIVSVDRIPNNTLSHVNYEVNTRKENRVYSEQEQLYSSRNIPRIKFNYNNYMANPIQISQPHYYSTAETFSHVGGSKIDYTVNFPLEVIAQKREKTEKEKSSVFSKKLVYNGVYQQFQLDQQIKKDLIRLNKL